MAVRSTPLWQGVALTSTAVTLLTTPADHTSLVKQLAFYNPSAGAAIFTFFQNGNGTAQIIFRRSVAAGTSLDLSGLFYVGAPGDTFWGASSVATCYTSAWGALLAPYGS